MTVAALASSISYLENGVTLAFPAPFRFKAPQHIRARRILSNGAVVDLAYGTDFSATGGETDAGGTVNLLASVAGATLVISRSTPRAQTMDCTTGDRFPAESHELAIDTAMLIDQEQDDQLADMALRALTVRPGQSMPSIDKTAFIGKFFGGDASGNLVPLSGTGNDSALRTDLAGPNGASLIGGLRLKLLANRTYYVRPDGNDNNSGLVDSAGGAFLTIQRAINVIYTLFDLNGFVVTIQVADGIYATPISLRGPLVGATADQPLRLIGNEASPANVVINTVNAHALTMQNGAYLLLAGVTTRTTTSGSGWNIQSNSFLEHRNCRFGNVANDMILCQHHASVKAIGPTTVDGAAVTFLHATKRSIIDFASQTLIYDVSIPSFSTYLIGINDASVNFDSATIVNKGSGRILVHDSGTLNVASLTGNYLGGFAPQVDHGGYIIDSDLMTARTLYVRTLDGNDANDGFADTAARAFKTLQAAIDTLAARPYDPSGYAPGAGWVIKLADGTYTEVVKLRDVPYPDVTIRGNTGSPGNVILSSAADGISAIGIRTIYNLEGFRLQAAAGQGIRAEQGSTVNFGNIQFGTCSGVHIYAISGASVLCYSNYTILSNAAYHLLARMNGVIDTQNRTVTLSGTPAFSAGFAVADMGGVIRALSMTFSGTGATGKRYDVTLNAVINVNGGGANYFPGSVAGTTATGGQYA